MFVGDVCHCVRILNTINIVCILSNILCSHYAVSYSVSRSAFERVSESVSLSALNSVI